MYRKAAEKLAEVAIDKQIISSDDKAMYIYAYEAMFARILGWGTLLLLGIFFQCIPGTIAFLLCFSHCGFLLVGTMHVIMKNVI